MSMKYKMSAQEKTMDYLARRDHSEKELRQKLKKHYTPEEIEDALEKCKTWLRPPEQLSEVTAHALHRKRKGLYFINQYLRKKGLPSVKKDKDVELQKAQKILQTKYSKNLAPEQLSKARRFLMSRGFDSETIRECLDWFKTKNRVN